MPDKWSKENMVMVVPQPPRGLWSWWPRWPTGAAWPWGRRAAASCSHHKSETFPARHETAAPRHPDRNQSVRFHTVTLLNGTIFSSEDIRTECSSATCSWGQNNTTYPLENIFPVVAELHEQGNLPAGVAVDSIDLQQEVSSENKVFEQTGSWFFEIRKAFKNFLKKEDIF